MKGSWLAVLRVVFAVVGIIELIFNPRGLLIPARFHECVGCIHPSVSRV